ncbi:hypothetical protein [Sphingomonas arantia]|uniref:hypothetical protein n=1 Tax=Sphingomonas arantia TaxID=1460676 RepID=UPI0036D394F5
MSTENYNAKRAREVSQVALEFARQMGGTFVSNPVRRNEYIDRLTKSEIVDNDRK